LTGQGRPKKKKNQGYQERAEDWCRGGVNSTEFGEKRGGLDAKDPGTQKQKRSPHREMVKKGKQRPEEFKVIPVVNTESKAAGKNQGKAPQAKAGGLVMARRQQMCRGTGGGRDTLDVKNNKHEKPHT